jgi:tRNA (cmo5U34)-methyltransferase
MKTRWGEYLAALKGGGGGGPAGEAYRDAVFTYIEQEDTPRPLTFQLELLRQTGFSDVDVLHKNALFAAFGGQKPG